MHVALWVVSRLTCRDTVETDGNRRASPDKVIVTQTRNRHKLAFIFLQNLVKEPLKFLLHEITLWDFRNAMYNSCGDWIILLIVVHALFVHDHDEQECARAHILFWYHKINRAIFGEVFFKIFTELGLQKFFYISASISLSQEFWPRFPKGLRSRSSKLEQIWTMV